MGACAQGAPACFMLLAETLSWDIVRATNHAPPTMRHS
jgi:hypothetical protein